ncbi:MAG: IS3 family transposase [Lachnospiraceae bacterium]
MIKRKSIIHLAARDALHRIIPFCPEEVYRRVYKDSNDAYNSIFEYIESWYNHRRAHSSLVYKTPDAVYAEGAA